MTRFRTLYGILSGLSWSDSLNNLSTLCHWTGDIGISFSVLPELGSRRRRCILGESNDIVGVFDDLTSLREPDNAY